MNVFHLIALIFGVMTLIFTFWGNMKSEKDVAGLNTKLQMKTEENLKLSMQINNYLQEEGSFCYFQPLPMDKTVNRIPCLMIIKGENPLRNVTISLITFKQFVKESFVKFDIDETYIDKAKKIAGEIIKYDILCKSKVFDNDKGKVLPLDGTMDAYIIQITTETKKIVQIIYFRKVKNDWEYAYKVSSGDKTLEQFVSDKYPMKILTEADWHQEWKSHISRYTK